MGWNWQDPNWPNFTYKPGAISEEEKQFLLNAGGSRALLKTLSSDERRKFTVEILAVEGLKSAEIEGEFLERDSLRSSIKRHFGLATESQRSSEKEAGMAELLCNVYDNYDSLLTHEMLHHWHGLLFSSDDKLDDRGRYRSHPEPMQIVSTRYGEPRVYFEAPPSEQVPAEMDAFVEWFNASDSGEGPLAKASIAHLYFESIHPFEDGNGRIGRALVEKILSQASGQPTLIALSHEIEKQKKHYYAELARCNKSLDAGSWVPFFSQLITQAQEASMKLLNFLIAKARLLTELVGQLNPRQEKVLLRMFEEGVEGFKGGLSADNYISMTKASRATATRDLVDLVEKGALVKTGRLRHTRYWLNL